MANRTWQLAAAVWLSASVVPGATGWQAAKAGCYPGLGDCAGSGTAGPVPLPTPPQQQAPQQQAPPVESSVEYLFVGPVFPPDPWLSLRSEPSSSEGYQIMKMPEGTLFRLLAKEGDWYQVQLRDGRAGWAHSRWIKCCRYLKP